ncbi:hypothetical protein OROGR_013624 [Orobanche gracilis]
MEARRGSCLEKYSRAAQAFSGKVELIAMEFRSVVGGWHSTVELSDVFSGGKVNLLVWTEVVDSRVVRVSSSRRGEAHGISGYGVPAMGFRPGDGQIQARAGLFECLCLSGDVVDRFVVGRCSWKDFLAYGLRCCEDGVRHRGMTKATRHSSDTSPELFGVLLPGGFVWPVMEKELKHADAEIDQNLTSGVTYATDPPSGSLARGADQAEGGAVDPSRIMKGMMTQMTQIVETMQTSTVRGPPQQKPQVPVCRHVGDVSQIVGGISRMRPPIFEGSSEPADIVHWLEHFDKLFDMVQCPEELKVAVAAYYLSKGAYSWWLSMKPTSRDCVWSEFKTLMLGRYHPAPLCEVKLSEILKPKSVEDEGVIVIAEKFYGLLQFASSIIRTEADKIKYFSRRLNPQLRLQLFNYNCSSLGKFIEKALGLELLIKELAQKNPSVSSERTKIPIRSGERQDRCPKDCFPFAFVPKKRLPLRQRVRLLFALTVIQSGTLTLGAQCQLLFVIYVGIWDIYRNTAGDLVPIHLERAHEPREILLLQSVLHPKDPVRLQEPDVRAAREEYQVQIWMFLELMRPER